MPTSTAKPPQDIGGTAAGSLANNGPDIADLDAIRLVRRAARGDPPAWDGLVDRQGRLIPSMVVARCHCAE